MGSSSDAVIYTSDLSAVFSKEFLDLEVTLEYGFTLKRVHDMIIMYSLIHRLEMYSQHSSIT